MLAAQVRELNALSQSPSQTTLLLLANTVTNLVLHRKTPTLLVTGNHSLPVMVVNLLLCRAGISLEQAVNPPWTEDQFTRLGAACRDVAGAPLIVVPSLPPAAFKNTLIAVASTYRRTWVVMDTATQPLACLKEISSQFRVPITIISSAGGQKPPSRQ